MNTKRDLLISKGWMQTVGIVGLCGFLSLGILAYRTYTDEPPIPSHSMSHRLHSLKLDTLGLAAAAKSFCCELAERQDVEVKFNSEEVLRKLPEAISLCLFRVLQEALQNAVKHRGVRHFRASLVGSTNQIALTVCDEGGRPEEVGPRGGLGLTSMKERLNLVGGKFEIDAKPSRGTIIRALVPLKPQTKFAGAGI